LSKKSRFKLFKTPIIAGRYKGKQILIPSLDTTRSSKSILRESLFNTIAFDVVDSNFVEMFAGSGSVGLEALSRGAKHSYFIERNKDVYALLQENISNIDSINATSFNADAFGVFDSIYASLKEQNQNTIFYFDPPFSIRDGMEDIYNNSIKLISKIKDSFVSLVVIEHMSDIDLPKDIGNLVLQKSKKFGKSTLSYYKQKD
jgi:16S rRNA (guanine(966)-N(2))-methyltransferase RsmD